MSDEEQGPAKPTPPSTPPPTPQSGQPVAPPKLSGAFLFLFVFGILVFVAGLGCTLVLTPFLFGGGGAEGVVGLLIMLAALYGFYRALRRGRHAERASEPPGQVLLFTLLLPVAAAFVWAGGCFLAVGGL